MNMEENSEKTVKDGPLCPLCGAIREDPDASRCANCGTDLTVMKSLEDFTNSLLLEARNDIRQRKCVEARTKLEIAASLDDRTAVAAKLIGTDIDINEHRYDIALDACKEVQESGFNASIYGIDLAKRISELELRLDTETAAKEHYNLALHRSKEGYFSEAREELYKSADLAPYLAEIYLLAAKVDLALGAEKAVLDDLTRYRQLRPDDPKGLRMEMELNNRKYETRINRDQLIYAIGMIIFAIAILIIIALK